MLAAYLMHRSCDAANPVKNVSSKQLVASGNDWQMSATRLAGQASLQLPDPVLAGLAAIFIGSGIVTHSQVTWHVLM